MNKTVGQIEDTSTIKVGDIVFFTTWGRVSRVTKDKPGLKVEDLDTGTEIIVEGQPLMDTSLSADRYRQTEKVTKTRAAELLVNSFNKPFTVVFTKQDGSERVLRGRLISAEPLLGRSLVEDLDLPRGENRERQVDHRTIKSLIIDNVKYVVR